MRLIYFCFFYYNQSILIRFGWRIILIKNIHNIVFASPSKSVIRVLQSIGRGLRKSETKDKVTIYDIGDDLRWKKHRNHALRHLDERINLYSNERFTYDVTKIRLKETP